ncbi:MAG: EI24 domain-containing protein, partial [Magnetococcales bacterium]|nr:EI24 domain-containing protein [Magnetococcales bacterium]
MRGNPVAGFFYVQRGVRIIFQPGLRRFVVLPITVNVIVFGLGTLYLYRTYRSTIGWLLDLVPSWLQWLEWVVAPVFMLLLVSVIYFAFTVVANLLGAPFNSLAACGYVGGLRSRENRGGGMESPGR